MYIHIDDYGKKYANRPNPSSSHEFCKSPPLTIANDGNHGENVSH